jgi:hypothetical protein
MVGLDTSHCTAFSRLLHDAEAEFHVPGARIVAAFPGGADQFSLSRDRVKGFTAEMEQQHQVALYDDIGALAQDVDALMLESVDGRQHPEQFEQMAIGKPVFIDKPFAVSAKAAREMIELSQETHTPIMSCSSLRYAAGIADLIGPDEEIVSCEAFGPAPILEDYPGLFWYGIHSAEILYTFMGRGCQAVRCIAHEDVDVVIGEWADGRLGIMKGTRFEKNAYGCVVHTGTGATCGAARSSPPYYAVLLEKVIEFFRTGVSPVDVLETLEIVSFIEAADRSWELGGGVVQLEVHSEQE